MEDAGKTVAAQKWKDAAAYAPAAERGGHAGSLTLPHLNSRKKKMRNICENFIWYLLLLIATGPQSVTITQFYGQAE